MKGMKMKRIFKSLVVLSLMFFASSCFADANDVNDVIIQNGKITCANPTDSNHAATKEYVDNVVSYCKVGVFYKNMSDADGTQTITGIGFKPRTIIFQGQIDNNPFWCRGVYSNSGVDGIAQKNIVQAYGYDGVAPDPSMTNGMTYAAIFLNVVSGIQQAYVSATSDDGFTLTWSKYASPTGRMCVIYIAYR
jgi:hypothetical protein